MKFGPSVHVSTRRSQIQTEPNQQAASKKRFCSLIVALSFGVGVAVWAWKRHVGASGAILAGDSHKRSPTPIIERRKSNSFSDKLPSSRSLSPQKLDVKAAPSWAGDHRVKKRGHSSRAFLSSEIKDSYTLEQWTSGLELCSQVACYSIWSNKEETDTWLGSRKPTYSETASIGKTIHRRSTSRESGITLPETAQLVLRESKKLPNPIPKIQAFLEKELQRTISKDLVIKFVNELRGIKTHIIDKEETRRFSMGMVERESSRQHESENVKERSLYFDEEVDFHMIRAHTLPSNIEDIGYLQATFELRKMTKVSEATSTGMKKVPSLLPLEDDPTNGEMKSIDAELQSVNAKLKKLRLKSIDWLTRGQGTNGFFELEKTIKELEGKKKKLQSKYDTACLTCINGLMSAPYGIEGDDNWDPSFQISTQSPPNFGALHSDHFSSELPPQPGQRRHGRSDAFLSPFVPQSLIHEQKIDEGEVTMKSRYDAAFREEAGKISKSRAVKDGLDYYNR